MSRAIISSPANGKIKQLQKLREKAAFRKREGVYLLEGKKSIREASPGSLREVYHTQEFQEREGHWLEALREAGVPCQPVSEAVFRKISEENTPSGVLAVVRTSTTALEELDLEGNPLLVALERIQDPGNLGTVIRTAHAAGARAVLVSKESADIHHPKALKSTMGSIGRIPVVQDLDLGEALEFLRERGVATWAAALEDSEDLFGADLSGKVCILVGNEGRGISRELLEAAQGRVRIPMPGGAESLNAAVAASVLLYEALRQRRQP
ncbi:TrmH family RNA methyltransferase [Anaerotalea alkaliphila]|uniref:RNA methyltransferase n=1 Tax=Anaerotalea alkaliphila TaxID=2662126 RepID=A0A7X5KND0_9FIRM|nr:RNA methyltransferase [Anaerotalea alkaliphila]NDL67668.1 RNA methyltransferase [Anaerotalea alkaliphila]